MYFCDTESRYQRPARRRGAVTRHIHIRPCCDQAEAVPMGYVGGETGPGLEDIAGRLDMLERAVAEMVGWNEESSINAGGSGIPPGGEMADAAPEFGGSAREQDQNDPGHPVDQMAARTPVKDDGSGAIATAAEMNKKNRAAYYAQRDELPASPSDANNRNSQQSRSMTAGSQSTPAPGAAREAERDNYMPNATGSIDVPRALSRTAKTYDPGQTWGVTGDALVMAHAWRAQRVATNRAIASIGAKWAARR